MEHLHEAKAEAHEHWEGTLYIEEILCEVRADIFAEDYGEAAADESEENEVDGRS